MDFDQVWERVKKQTGWKTQTDLANGLNIKSGSVSGAKKRGSFPLEWAFAIAQQFNISTDYLLTGKGDPGRKNIGGAYSASPKPGDAYTDSLKPGEAVKGCLNTGPEHTPWKLSEKITRAADILESDTIYKDALAANIDAFHQAMTAEQRMNEMEDNMKDMQEKFTDFEQRFKALEEENSRLRQKLHTGGDAGAKAVNQD